VPTTSFATLIIPLCLSKNKNTARMPLFLDGWQRVEHLLKTVNQALLDISGIAYRR
jgi:hypothetical protein